jgi:hypothetical protein
MSATLLLTRPLRVSDAAQPYHVLLDGETVDVVRNHSSAKVPVTAGEHAAVSGLLAVRYFRWE